MNSGFECDLEKTWEKFIQLTHDEIHTGCKKALRTAGKELQRVTKQNLTSRITKRSNKRKYLDQIEDAVRLSKIEEENGEEMVQKVHIMGTRTKDEDTGMVSGTFRARFLEKGTKPRYAKTIHKQPLKKKRYLGSIKPKWFFKDAQATVEPQLTTIYMREIQKTLDKINNS